MARKRHTGGRDHRAVTDHIEIELGKGLGVVEACHKLGITEQNCGMNGSTSELFYTLHEARVIVEGGANATTQRPP